MLEFVPPHFPSSYWWEAIIERTKGDGGFAIVEDVYETDGERLKLCRVSQRRGTGVCLEGFAK